MSKPIRKYRDKLAKYNPVWKDDSLTEAVLQDWYEKFKPEGSGPHHVCTWVCALIEYIAEAKGFSLK